MFGAKKRISTLFIVCIALNGLAWLLVSLFSLPPFIREFSMGFLFSIAVLYAILHFKLHNKI
jgi:hypothetical protein